MSEKNSAERQLKFGWDKIWNCLRGIPMRCNWNLAETNFGIALEEFRWDAIDFWLWHSLEMS